MTEDKPLHVQVAEALGWTDMKPRADDGLWGGKAPDVSWEWTSPPRYDTDWAATGPLIEKYGFQIWRNGEGVWEAQGSQYKDGEHVPGSFRAINGPTPLEAVCHLILALKAAGKLEAA